MQQFIEKYFLNPILNYEGYNIINTGTYAIIAAVAIFLITKIIERKKIKLDQTFYYGVIAFVLFGSIFRVMVDATDANRLQVNGLLSTHKIFEYSILTVSPTIYILVALLFFLTYYFELKLKQRFFTFFVGLICAFFCFLNLIFILKNLIIAILILTISISFYLLALKITKIKNFFVGFIIFSHLLDGASTWIAIDLAPVFDPALKYGEQHVVPRLIGQFSPFGYFGFFLIKFLFALVIAKMLDQEQESELKKILTCALIVIGLAPGIRDFFRIFVGV